MLVSNLWVKIVDDCKFVDEFRVTLKFPSLFPCRGSLPGFVLPGGGSFPPGFPGIDLPGGGSFPPGFLLG